MAMEFAKRTSPNHSTTKASFKEKMANFRSAFSTAYRDREKYGTFHCNLILKGFSNNLIRQGGCGKHNEPCWPDPVREPASDLGFSKVDEMRELDTLAYCLKDHSLVTSKALSMNISSEAFRGGEIEAEGKSGRNFPMNRLLWLGLMAISRHEQGGFSDVEIIETINNLVITESVKGLKCQDPEKLESTLVFALSELRKRSPVSAETLELHLKSLKGIGLRLKALRQARSHLADLADRKVDLSTTLAQSAHSFDAMLANSSNSLFEAADAAFEDFEKSLFDGKNRYVPTPSKHFNELLNGGFQAGRLYGLGAPPKTGKTAFLWWQAQLAAEKGFPVVFCSYEIPAPELLTNAVSRIAKVDSRKLESRVWNQLPVESKDIIQSVKDGLRQYKQKTKPNVLLIEGGPDLPVATIRGAITLVRKHRGLAHDHPVLVIVDSLQKVPIGNEVFDNSVNETPRISRIVNELKWIARDMKVPVVAISEITKDSMNSALSDGNVEINCFKGSSGIQHGADCLMVLQSNDVERYDKEGDCNYSVDQLQLHYENMGKPDCLEQLEVKDHYPLDIAAHSCYARLSILMSRAGKSGDVMFRYDRAYHDFVPIDLQDLPKPGTSLGW
jgi:replicative DNA helicase